MSYIVNITAYSADSQPISLDNLASDAEVRFYLPVLPTLVRALQSRDRNCGREREQEPPDLEAEEVNAIVARAQCMALGPGGWSTQVIEPSSRTRFLHCNQMGLGVNVGVGVVVRDHTHVDHTP